MKQLSREQRAFKADEISYLDRKFIHLDRMLLNLFELLRFDGRPPVRARRKPVEISSLVGLMNEHPDRFVGFAPRPEVAEAWLESDLLEIMNRGKLGREMVVGPRPFHLNAFKLVNSKAASDYGASTQVWAMLFHADPTLLERLKTFFGQGLDTATDRYDKHTPLDLQTLAILGLVDQVQIGHATTAPSDPLVPICSGQGRLLAEDLRALLAYEQAIPRHVLADYLRTTIGLHLALFVLRLFHLVPSLVSSAQRGASISSCAIDDGVTSDGSACPFRLELTVDLTDDRTSPSAALAIRSGASTWTRQPLMFDQSSCLTESKSSPSTKRPWGGDPRFVPFTISCQSYEIRPRIWRAFSTRELPRSLAQRMAKLKTRSLRRSFNSTSLRRWRNTSNWCVSSE